jgi:alkanesulfonate monooxygenase SsuD/methylene tetrahydromethanopterin reductase-like flavin-dependent oxidoreductase (luciferase family)
VGNRRRDRPQLAGGETTTLKVGSAIMQIPARTPAMTAMTARTLDLMSGGRFLLGLGTSGPAGRRGWHGQPWGKPLGQDARVRRDRAAALRREELRARREHYGIPYTGRRHRARQAAEDDAAARCAPTSPIYLAAIGPKNVALAAEIADGWLLVWGSGTDSATRLRPVAREGFAAAAATRRRSTSPAWVPVVADRRLELGYGVVKPQLALYVGGMGARGQNFYNSLIRRYGYEAEARPDPVALPRRQEARGGRGRPDALARRGLPRRPARSDRRAPRRLARVRLVTTLIVSAARSCDSIRTMAELSL